MKSIINKIGNLTLGIGIGIGLSMGMQGLAVLTVDLGVDGAVQYIKKIFLTTDGTNDTSEMIILDGTNGNVSIKGNLTIYGNISDPNSNVIVNDGLDVDSNLNVGGDMSIAGSISDPNSSVIVDDSLVVNNDLEVRGDVRLEDGVINTSEIANDAITKEKLAENSVGSREIIEDDNYIFKSIEVQNKDSYDGNERLTYSERVNSADTCNNDKYNKYVCSSNDDMICTDIYRYRSFWSSYIYYYKRDVNCRKDSVFEGNVIVGGAVKTTCIGACF